VRDRIIVPTSWFLKVLRCIFFHDLYAQKSKSKKEERNLEIELGGFEYGMGLVFVFSNSGLYLLFGISKEPQMRLLRSL